MNAHYISELAEGSRVDSTFLLRSREMRAARNGDAYMSMEFSDRTGSITGLLFRPKHEATLIPVGTPVRVAGTITVYRGSKRISVTSLRAADDWNPGDLIGTGTRDVAELKSELNAMVGELRADLRRLVRAVFKDPVFLERFCSCPASQSYHHAYLGGLLEHTVSVASICQSLAGQYDGADMDLLIAAAVLHDVGKVDELSFEAGISYTDEGRFLGHVVSTLSRVEEASHRARIDDQVLLKLRHALVSHHGELEWGSPKRPVTFEALLLHHVDNLDAKASGFASLLRGASLIEESWTDASNLFRRPLYAPRPAEDDRLRHTSEDEAHFQMSA